MKKLIEWFISLWQPKKLISCEDVCTPELLCETNVIVVPPPETFHELYDSKCAGIARGITGDEWISEGGSELRCFTRFEYLAALKVDSMMKPQPIKPRVPMAYVVASVNERDRFVNERVEPQLVKRAERDNSDTILAAIIAGSLL